MAVSTAPRVDIHSHPGRCFLAGLDASDPLAGMLGGEDIRGALASARDAGMAAITLATVADLRVLAPDPVGIDHVAIGTDMDASYRPVLNSYADFAILPELLAARGVSDAGADRILGLNFLALMRAVADDNPD
jgi:Membrane dipeptidase (Peptidase family M19)